MFDTDEKQTIIVDGQRVDIDRGLLHFNELTLGEYIEKEGGYIDYFGAKLSEAERELANIDSETERLNVEYDTLFSRKFADYKLANGGSDTLVEAKIKADLEVDEAKKKVLESKRSAIEAKYRVRLLTQHLRAWDKNHENAQSRGHFLRKEMDKLNRDIYLRDKMGDPMDDVIKEIDLNKPLG